MTTIHLSLSCDDDDINRVLIEGAVVPQGVDLTVITAPSPARHWRNVSQGGFFPIMHTVLVRRGLRTSEGPGRASVGDAPGPLRGGVAP